MGAGATKSLPVITENDMEASIKIVEIIYKLDEIQKASALPYWAAYQEWLRSIQLYFQGIQTKANNAELKDFLSKGISSIANPKTAIPPGIAGFDDTLYKSLVNYSMFLYGNKTIAKYRELAGFWTMPDPPQPPPEEWVRLKARLNAIKAQGGGKRKHKHKKSRKHLTRRRRK